MFYMETRFAFKKFFHFSRSIYSTQIQAGTVLQHFFWLLLPPIIHQIQAGTVLQQLFLTHTPGSSYPAALSKSAVGYGIVHSSLDKTIKSAQFLQLPYNEGISDY